MAVNSKLYLDFKNVVPRANTKNELPLNEYLLQRRKFLKLRFADLSSRTGIPNKHLKKIENGDWLGLPPGVYTKGFLRKYARAVGLDEGEVCFRYDHELVALRLNNKNNSAAERVPKVNFHGLKKTPALGFIFHSSFRRMVAVFLVMVVVFYVFWQFKAVLEKPELILNYPAEEDIVLSDSKINLTGRTSPGAVLSINNEMVYPEADGSFSKEVELLDGLNVLEIKTVSRFGKENKITKRVTYNP